MNIANNQELHDKVNILKLTEERINKLVEEKVTYLEGRYYFGAGGIKGKRIGFTFTYSKKTSELGFQAESADVNGAPLLKKAFEENKRLIEESVGLNFTLDAGSKNENWYRLITKIFLDDGRDIIEQIDELVSAFLKFKSIMIDIVNNVVESSDNNVDIQKEDIIDYANDLVISKKQWVDLLSDNSIFREKDINLILLIYVMGGKTTAKDLSTIENTHPTSYNSWIVSLSKRILSKLNLEPPKRANGKEVYWCIPFSGQELSNNSFQWILKEELHEALTELIVDKKLDINMAENKYERGIVNLRKVKSDSWIDDININNENFLGRKTIDYSMLNYGTIIPFRYHEIFLNHLSKEVPLGGSVPIKVKVNDREYSCTIDKPNSKGRKSTVLRFNYRNKVLKELLQKEFETTYDFIIEYEKENDKKPNNIPEEFEGFIDFYKGNEKDNFIINLLPKGSNQTLEKIDEDNNPDEDFEENEVYTVEDSDNFRVVENIEEELNYIHQYISSKGFDYSNELIKNFYVSLRTKPFVILSGISGTGKSKIVELFAEAVGATYKNERFKLIPVKPDWSDATDLLGYRNIEGKFTPGIITSIAYEAMKNPELPYFICLDEMNLARVEYYFSDILSLMETRRVDEDSNIITEKILSKEQFGRDERSKDSYGDVYLPQNLYIVGTVNMDETTFPFSKKVLDRANTIEFNKVNLQFSFEDRQFQEVERRIYKNDFLSSNYLKLTQCVGEKELATKVINQLININEILEDYNQHFGFRVRDEIVFYMIYATNENSKILDYNNALDLCIVQKVLPKISGSNGDVLEILIRLFNLLNKTNYEYTSYLDESEIKDMMKKSKESSYLNSSEKLVCMIRRFVRDGFTTFWQ